MGLPGRRGRRARGRGRQRPSRRGRPRAGRGGGDRGRRPGASSSRFSRWITPPEVKIRFDTHFFLAPLPEGAQPRVDGDECVDLGWFTPADALAAHTAGELLLVFPTIKHLEQLSSFASADELLAFATGREVVAVTPRVVMSGEQARILLPGEPGYDEAPAAS